MLARRSVTPSGEIAIVGNVHGATKIASSVAAATPRGSHRRRPALAAQLERAANTGTHVAAVLAQVTADNTLPEPNRHAASPIASPTSYPTCAPVRMRPPKRTGHQCRCPACTTANANLRRSMTCKSVTAGTAQLVNDMYEQLWDAPPPCQTIARRNASDAARARHQAQVAAAAGLGRH